MSKITLVNQRKEGSGIACIAMVAGTTYAEIKCDMLQAFNSTYMDQHMLYATLKLKGIFFIPYGVNSMVSNRHYIMSVPSLNEDNHVHYIVADTYTGEVFDPNRGLDGKKFYSDINKLGQAHSVIEVFLDRPVIEIPIVDEDDEKPYYTTMSEEWLAKNNIGPRIIEFLRSYNLIDYPLDLLANVKGDHLGYFQEIKSRLSSVYDLEGFPVSNVIDGIKHTFNYQDGKLKNVSTDELINIYSYNEEGDLETIERFTISGGAHIPQSTTEYEKGRLVSHNTYGLSHYSYIYTCDGLLSTVHDHVKNVSHFITRDDEGRIIREHPKPFVGMPYRELFPIITAYTYSDEYLTICRGDERVDIPFENNVIDIRK